MSTQIPVFPKKSRIETIPHDHPLMAVDRALTRRRTFVDRIVRVVVVIAFALAVAPLISVLWTVISKGAHRLFADFPYFLTVSMNGVYGGIVAGGIYHALIGTLIITACATIISVPLGILSAVYLVEYGNKSRLAKILTFVVDIMTGIPSIVAGLFAAAAFALFIGPGYRAGIIGAVALTVLMIPTVVRSSEEILRLIPLGLREAALALGVPRWRVIVKVVLRTSAAGLVTGAILAIARVIGETAPLLVTVGTLDAINTNVFSGRMMTLPVYVYRQYAMGDATCIKGATNCLTSINSERAWAAALVLIIVVMAINVCGRVIAHIFRPKGDMVS